MNSIHLNFLGSAPDSVIERVKFIDADHITGSLGQIKFITDYDSAGNAIKKTQFDYTDIDYPTQVSRIRELEV